MAKRVFQVLTRSMRLIALLAASTAAFAQNTPSVNYTSFDATSAAPVQLGYYAVIRKDCSPAPPVTIRVSQPPKLGVFTIRPGEITTFSSGPCPGSKVPAEVVFYQARGGAAGSDHLVYEVIDASHRPDVYDVTITIKPAQAPTAARLDKPI